MRIQYTLKFSTAANEQLAEDSWESETVDDKNLNEDCSLKYSNNY